MLLFLGATPPPLGGVAVYCVRRIEQLRRLKRSFKHFDSKLKINLIKLIAYAWYLSIRRTSYEIEVNVSNPFVFFVLVLSGISQHCIYYDHNGSRRSSDSKIKKYIFTLFYNKCKRLMLVNDNLRENYCDSVNKKITIDAPFLPPSEIELKHAEKAFPAKFKYLTQGHDRNIVLTTAWRPVSTETENDLYGLIDSLDIYEELLPIYSDYYFVMMIGEMGTCLFSKQIQGKIKALSRFSNFIFITGGVSQLPLMNRVKVLLRLTKTDGDSVSVREAIHSGAKVIATNVGYRPPETILVDTYVKGNLQKSLINTLKS